MPTPTPSGDPILLRDARWADLPEINAIYNHFVLSSTATYQEAIEPTDGREAWFARHGGEHPVTVATLDGGIVGWASLSPYHPRSAYRRTAESSVYIHAAFHRRGIGKALMVDLIERGRRLGHHTLIAGIDAEQTSSLALHEALGFERVGHLKQVGFKFGRWLDVIYMQLML